MVYIVSMNLNDYIKQVGRKEAASKFHVSAGSISHWLTGRRRPSPDKAKEITANSPVTWEGIYGKQAENE